MARFTPSFGSLDSRRIRQSGLVGYYPATFTSSGFVYLDRSQSWIAHRHETQEDSYDQYPSRQNRRNMRQTMISESIAPFARAGRVFAEDARQCPVPNAQQVPHGKPMKMRGRSTSKCPPKHSKGLADLCICLEYSVLRTVLLRNVHGDMLCIHHWCLSSIRARPAKHEPETRIAA